LGKTLNAISHLGAKQGRSESGAQGARPPIEYCLALLKTNNEQVSVFWLNFS